MRFHHHAWSVLVAALSIASLACMAQASEEAGPVANLPLPAQDPFYSPPPGFERLAPGTVLRTRKANIAFLGFVPAGVATWQLLYRSSTANGSAIAAVTTIFRPSQFNRSQFISYMMAYNSGSPNCIPSFNWRRGSGPAPRRPLDNWQPTVELLRIQGYLLQGFIVSAPDHEGPDSAFSAGRVSGRCVLDSMRATINFGPDLGFSVPKPAVIGTGYSGGGIPVIWAAALQGSYAPELPIKGWVVGGAPVNWTEVILTIHKGTVSGLVFTGFVGLMSYTAYQTQLKPLWDKVVTARGRQMFDFIRTHCLEVNTFKYAYSSILSEKFQALGPSIMQHPTVKRVLKDNYVGLRRDETPIAPVFLYHGRRDQIVPSTQSASLAKTWCSRKASVTFAVFGGEHMTTSMLAIPRAYRFVNAAFAGNISRECIQDVDGSKGLSPIRLPAKLKPLINKLATYLDRARHWDRENPGKPGSGRPKSLERMDSQ